MKKYLLSGIALGFAAALSASTALADITIAVAGPITGQYAAFGEQLKRGAEMAVADINAAGGVNGEKLVLEIGDDACDPKQAVAVANQMVSKGIKFMAGHFCSGSSIPAADIYAEEGIIQISGASTNPEFTEKGLWNTHRVCGRDDAQGIVAGKFLAKNFKGKKIAIIDDKSPYGKGLADETGIEAVYVGGYHTEGGLILRQMREQGMSAQMVSGDAFNTEEFWTITGSAGEGMIFTFAPEPRNNPAAKEVVERFKAAGYDPEGYTLYEYAAIQAWAAGAAATGGTDGKKIAEWLRAGNPFKTVLGELALNEKGDVKDAVYVWYKFSNGKYTEDPSLQ
jgi:branched-chain amino acid transport system substrate-binding protein